MMMMMMIMLVLYMLLITPSPIFFYSSIIHPAVRWFLFVRDMNVLLFIMTLLDSSVVAVLCWLHVVSMMRVRRIPYWIQQLLVRRIPTRRVWLSDTTPSSLIALWMLYVIVTLSHSQHTCLCPTSDGRVVNLPSFLPAVMTSSVGVVMSCQWSVSAQ